MSVIEAKGLGKAYQGAGKEKGLAGAVKHLFHPAFRGVRAVHEVSLSIDAAETVAYVGPHGAGKSTTIKMLTGILLPSSGSVTVNGMAPYHCRMENTKSIGVVFGQRTQLWWDNPVIESFTLIRDIYEIPPKKYAQLFRFLAKIVSKHFPLMVYQMADFAKYPPSLFGKAIEVFIIFVIPSGFISSVPAVWLFGKAWWGVFAWAVPLVAVWCAFAVRWMFYRGLRRYEGSEN